MNGNRRVHDWRKLKWPFTATFVYYALLSLFTGRAEPGELGFVSVLLFSAAVDAFVYFCYCRFLCPNEENPRKLWYLFIMAYLVLSAPQLREVLHLLQSRLAP